jgi:hypothetical protein
MGWAFNKHGKDENAYKSLIRMLDEGETRKT